MKGTYEKALNDYHTIQHPFSTMATVSSEIRIQPDTSCGVCHHPGVQINTNKHEGRHDSLCPHCRDVMLVPNNLKRLYPDFNESKCRYIGWVCDKCYYMSRYVGPQDSDTKSCPICHIPGREQNSSHSSANPRFEYIRNTGQWYYALYIY
jgi:hypothetical protein